MAEIHSQPRQVGYVKLHTVRKPKRSECRISNEIVPIQMKSDICTQNYVNVLGNVDVYVERNSSMATVKKS